MDYFLYVLNDLWLPCRVCIYMYIYICILWIHNLTCYLYHMLSPLQRQDLFFLFFTLQEVATFFGPTVRKSQAAGPTIQRPLFGNLIKKVSRPLGLKMVGWSPIPGGGFNHSPIFTPKIGEDEPFCLKFYDFPPARLLVNDLKPSLGSVGKLWANSDFCEELQPAVRCEGQCSSNGKLGSATCCQMWRTVQQQWKAWQCNLLSDVKDSAAAMESLAAGVNYYASTTKAANSLQAQAHKQNQALMPMFNEVFKPFFVSRKFVSAFCIHFFVLISP